MSGKEVLIGGEESGGIGIPRHLPERDGILNSLLSPTLWPTMARRSSNSLTICNQEFGPHYYGRRDLHIPEEVKQGALRRAAAGPSRSASTRC